MDLLVERAAKAMRECRPWEEDFRSTSQAIEYWEWACDNLVQAFSEVPGFNPGNFLDKCGYNEPIPKRLIGP